MREVHPYGEFFPKNVSSIIIGSFPIGKFSNPKRRHEIKEHEFDFFFGGEKNLLWKLLGEVFNCPIKKKSDITSMLNHHGIGIGDVIKSCRRKDGGGSDSDLYDIEWNGDLLHKINKRQIRKVYFTSKKVEQWFKKLFPGPHEFEMITLISPSAQSVRSIPKRPDYLEWIKNNPDKRIFEFILYDYRKKFET